MYRHIFWGTLKAGVTEAQKAEMLTLWRAMADEIPAISALAVGFSTGWTGIPDQLVMTVDFDSPEAFEAYRHHPYHLEVIDRSAQEMLREETFVAQQFCFHPV